jgi:HSP20 family protein
MHLFKHRTKKADDVTKLTSRDVEPVKDAEPVKAVAVTAPAATPEVVDMFFDRFDRLFDEWTRLVPFRGSELLDREWVPAELIRVDQIRDDGALVVRAELPGLDPDKDVEVTVSDGILSIDARRREEDRAEKDGYLRQEIRYGAFRRSLPLPGGVTASDIAASYRDGILEIRIPTCEATPASRVTITKT